MIDKTIKSVVISDPYVYTTGEVGITLAHYFNYTYKGKNFAEGVMGMDLT